MNFFYTYFDVEKAACKMWYVVMRHAVYEFPMIPIISPWTINQLVF
jgi:hypothetical protein